MYKGLFLGGSAMEISYLWGGAEFCGERKVILVSREIFCGGERVRLCIYCEGGVNVLGGGGSRSKIIIVWMYGVVFIEKG